MPNATELDIGNDRSITSELREAASKLRRAYDGETIEPLRAVMEGDDADSAYAIQDLNTRFWQQQGRSLTGRKIGLTSPAVQTQLGVSQPDFGALFDDMKIENGGTLKPERCIQPKAEAEVALVLKSDLRKEQVTRDDVAKATGYAVAAIEIVDSRIADWRITFADTVADNGSSAFYVLGDDKVALDGLDLYSCGMVLEVDGRVSSIGAGAACLGHPLDAAAWLANTLVKRGEVLRAGDIILTGALGPMITLAAGSEISAQIGGLGRCSFRYGE